MSATSKVFGSSELSGNIFEFLTLEDRLACRNTNKDLRDNAQAFAHPSRTVFAVSWTRNAILDFLPAEDLDRCKRVKRSWRRNITEFQRARLPRQFPEELREIVRGAQFQIVNVCRVNSITYNHLSTAVVAGYARGRPFLACRVHIVFYDTPGRVTTSELQVVQRISEQRISDNGWYVAAGWVSGDIRSFTQFVEFIRIGKFIPNWARPYRRSSCQRICDIFRRLCGCPKPPEERFPQYHLGYSERDVPNERKDQNSK